MADASRSIRVQILDRDYPLRVAPAAEEQMLYVASQVDRRLRTLREQLPGQRDLTYAVLGALALAEEFATFETHAEMDRSSLEGQLEALAAKLDAVLDAG